jgi:hypothetical protein
VTGRGRRSGLSMHGIGHPVAEGVRFRGRRTTKVDGGSGARVVRRATDLVRSVLTGRSVYMR